MPPERFTPNTGNGDDGKTGDDRTPLFTWNREPITRVADPQTQANGALRADAYKDSVVFIKTNDGKKPDGTDATTAGSGFFVNKDGLLATDYHVIKDNKGQITVTTADGVVHTATIKAVDPGHDLALLQVQPVRQGEVFIPIDLASNSSDLRSTDEVVTRGHPHRSTESKLATGRNNAYTSLDTFDLQGGLLPGEIANRTVITSGMDVESGNSGGPLIRKSDGKVVGVVDFTSEATRRAVSTPVEDLHRLIASTQQIGQQPALASRFNIQDLVGTSATAARVNPYPSFIQPSIMQNGFRYQVPSASMIQWERPVVGAMNPNATRVESSTISIFANMRVLPRRN